MTLEQLLKMKVGEGKDEKPVVEFRVKVQNTFDRGVHFIIHPEGVDGETIDFMVSDNLLTDLKEKKRLKKA
jgi:hypothetical protein